jgi:hypothetical protein
MAFMKTNINRLLAAAVAYAAAASTGTFEIQAQEITPVWVQHLNKTDNLLPILRKQDGPTELADGTSSFDNYVAFLRYDATRLLLGVRENGINESDPSLSAADRALAAQYPDRSIIWINPTNGAPMGVAHKVPDLPGRNWPRMPRRARTISSGIGALMRVPKASVPSTRPTSTSSCGGLRWRADGPPPPPWRGPSRFRTSRRVMAAVVAMARTVGDGAPSRVAGSGVNTAIYAGGGTWRSSMHVQKFTTKDGLKFEPAARVNDRDGGVKGRYSFSGMNTKAVKYAKDPSRPNLELFFTPSFPASGRELKPRRFSRNPDSTRSGSFTEAPPAAQQFNRNNFFDPDSAASAGLPAFRWEGDEAPFPSGTAVLRRQLELRHGYGERPRLPRELLRPELEQPVRCE